MDKSIRMLLTAVVYFKRISLYIFLLRKLKLIIYLSFFISVYSRVDKLLFYNFSLYAESLIFALKWIFRCRVEKHVAKRFQYQTPLICVIHTTYNRLNYITRIHAAFMTNLHWTSYYITMIVYKSRLMARNSIQRQKLRFRFDRAMSLVKVFFDFSLWGRFLSLKLKSFLFN